ncbi:MAG: DNA gyrase/topoisomerase IV subunit B [Christensenellales bacterium]|jgi:DNA gyrase subunit B
MAKAYQASDIQVLEGMEAVRHRPGMYIGSTGSRGLHHLLWEMVDNAVDEAANGYATQVGVTLHTDGGVTVEDNGRGIPVGIHPQLQVSGVEVVFTQLHAGGKFDDSNYAYSGGLHGVGASVVNALSRRLICEVGVDGKLYRQEFQSIEDKKTGKILGGEPMGALEEIGPSRRKGSRITFWPDDRIFEETEFDSKLVSRRLRELAFLNAGIRIVFTDERERENGKYKVREYSYGGGLIDFVRYNNQSKTVLNDPPIYLEGQKDDLRVSVALQYTDAYGENLLSYVNNIPTTEGGTHETGFRAAMTKVFNEYARRNNLLKDKEAALMGEDYRDGLTAVLLVKMKNVQFEGQTKSKLGNTEARTAVEAIVTEKLTLWIDDIKNAGLVGSIVEKARKAASVREAARKAKDIARKRHALEGAQLVGKLSACTGRKAEENELFIVEGDSAGGSAKQGRDRRYQAVLPLRGKPLNAEKKRLDEVLANEEFRTLIAALGTGIDSDFSLKNLKYRKVIILSDADQDGAHIRAILLTFFFRYMRELVLAGHVYIGVPPLYQIKAAKKSQYIYSDRELKKATAGLKQYTIQRYKGLGEMNPEQLWETTMNPSGRTLIQVSIDDAAEADRIVTVLMGEKVDSRKEYISAHANFNREDAFEQIGG